jgi:hypothetical protein
MVGCPPFQNCNNLAECCRMALHHSQPKFEIAYQNLVLTRSGRQISGLEFGFDRDS